MKKKNVINLIKYFAEGNVSGFRTEAYEIAHDFQNSGDDQLAQYIMALLSDANTFVPQYQKSNFTFLEKTDSSNASLPLPEVIQQDILGILNAMKHNMGVNKFLFKGRPGTGKTETAKQLSRILGKELYIVNTTQLIDSKLGQTQKNIQKLFAEINEFNNPDKIIVLFDELDAIALDRTNSNDLREMGRATTSVLKGLDSIDGRVMVIATTNLYEFFDKALIRRFDAIIDFDRYSLDDLVDIGEIIFNQYSEKAPTIDKNRRMLRKILFLMDKTICPGDLNNLIKTSIAFSNPDDSFDYMKRLYLSITQEKNIDLKKLQEQGFTVREIELLSGVSKSQVARELRGNER